MVSIIDRIEEIRDNERLSKNKFEAVLGKSSGYFNTIRRNGSIPGSDVLIKISENYPEYNMRWIMTGDGNMMLDNQENKFSGAKEEDVPYKNPELSELIIDSENRVRKDLAAMTAGLTHNFEVISNGIFKGLKEQQKILGILEELNVEKFNKAASNLEVYLNK